VVASVELANQEVRPDYVGPLPSPWVEASISFLLSFFVQVSLPPCKAAVLLNAMASKRVSKPRAVHAGGLLLYQKTDKAIGSQPRQRLPLVA
jgi:hypothetical protein